jgi:hypothetical protein
LVNCVKKNLATLHVDVLLFQKTEASIDTF